MNSRHSWRSVQTVSCSVQRKLHYQGIAYARPIEWDAKGDNMAAVIFLNVVEGDRFKEVGEITRGDLPN